MLIVICFILANVLCTLYAVTHAFDAPDRGGGLRDMGTTCTRPPAPDGLLQTPEPETPIQTLIET